ncbi:alpha/beta hydrolase family protein [Nocardia sp. NBC_00403]|uniref:alpha/beta hydrolase family protein n=1 Tax=Nocardia sp. NBC_00403 TaxID=2975990 RepID=UPI002E24AB11
MRKLWFTTAIACACAASLLTLSAATADPAGGPGTVTSIAPLAAVATLPGSVNSTRIIYRTSTANNVPTEASAAVYFPPGPAPAGGWPVIAWAHGTVGLGDDCAYSITGPSAAERDWAYLGTWLQQGYAIVAADYAGLGTPDEHPYLNGMVMAHNVVDAVQAATRQYSSLAKKWAVVGQSQGAGAAAYTARYATEFGGPELDYRGAVTTGVPAYIEDVLLPLAPHMPPIKLSPHSTAYVLYILNGLRTTYGDTVGQSPSENRAGPSGGEAAAYSDTVGQSPSENRAGPSGGEAAAYRDTVGQSPSENRAGPSGGEAAAYRDTVGQSPSENRAGPSGGEAAAYPTLNIESFLTDAGREWLTRARDACIGPLGDELAARGVVLGDLFSRPLLEIPDLHGFLARYMALPESGYNKPLFIGQGLRDTDVITPESLRWAAVLKANGQPVTLHTYPTDHSGTVNASLPDSLPFVHNLFA